MTYLGQNFNLNLKKIVHLKNIYILKYFFEDLFKNIPRIFPKNHLRGALVAPISLSAPWYKRLNLAPHD